MAGRSRGRAASQIMDPPLPLPARLRRFCLVAGPSPGAGGRRAARAGDGAARRPPSGAGAPGPRAPRRPARRGRLTPPPPGSLPISGQAYPRYLVRTYRQTVRKY
jgi:hypothetical protein